MPRWLAFTFLLGTLPSLTCAFRRAPTHRIAFAMGKRLQSSASGDMSALKLSELKELCKSRGLATSGTKAELRSRLEAAPAAAPEAAARGASAPSPKRPRRSQRIESSPQPAASAAEEDEGEEDALGGSLPKKREELLRGEGYELIIGIDEAGRGPLAGPVVAAACAMPLGVVIPGINDSKQTTEEEREAMYDLITSAAGVRWAVAVIDNRRIDAINILQATMEGMTKSAAAVLDSSKGSSAPASIDRRGCYVVAGGNEPLEPFKKGRGYALVDGNRVPQSLPCRGEAMVKGDGREYIIGAASILAKVTRDRLMVAYDARYPQYGLAQHKGYPTAMHTAAVWEHGPCDIHRRTFAPIKDMDLPDKPKNPFEAAKLASSRRRAAGAKPAPAAGEKEEKGAGDGAEDAPGDFVRAVEGLEGAHPSWQAALSSEVRSASFRGLLEFLRGEVRRGHTLYPPKERVYAALGLCPLEDVKVVILGQDPYINSGQANGLAFSVGDGIAIPPSLRNIFKELGQDLGHRPPPRGALEPWARQGVLLLNTVLTVRAGKSNSHQKQGWEPFTDAVIRAVSDRRSGVVFVLWGKPSQRKRALIDEGKHHVLMSSHPSPLSATRATKDCGAFMGSRVFSKTNELLREQGDDPIDWKLSA